VNIVKEKVEIITPYITLGQLLKETGIISTGGQAKWFLQETLVLVNEEADNRRGRKLYPGDTIEVAKNGIFLITTDRETTD